MFVLRAREVEAKERAVVRRVEGRISAVDW